MDSLIIRLSNHKNKKYKIDYQQFEWYISNVSNPYKIEFIIINAIIEIIFKTT